MRIFVCLYYVIRFYLVAEHLRCGLRVGRRLEGVVEEASVAEVHALT